jgi:plastocyanin
MHSRIRIAAAALSAALLAAGCTSDGTGSDDEATPQVTVHLTAGLQFAPATLTVDRGTIVQWVNDRNVAHTITPNNPGQTGAWTSHDITGSGTTFSHTFATAGDFPYHCNVHAGMTGTIHVN